MPAGLRYVSDEQPGYARKRWGRGFRYFDRRGRPVSDAATRQRFKDLEIPPAWEDVWICPDPRGHLQATGRDARGRKVYLYHERWRTHRDRTKYDNLSEFGHALPAIREQIERDLARDGLPRDKVLAMVVKLLEATMIRVGNTAYAKNNGHYGLTTLRRKHVELNGDTVTFSFKGKSGREHEIALTDRTLAEQLERCCDLPGYELFKYIDDDGDKCVVDSGEVNEYLERIAGPGVTAKSFRTWAGTVICAVVLGSLPSWADEKECESRIVTAVKATADQLGNRPATCRRYYIHPMIFDAYRDGSLRQLMRAWPERLEPQARRERLHPEEAAVLALLDAGKSNSHHSR